MRGNGYGGELVLGSINFCYCYLLYVAGPRILETIYPIGWRKSAKKRLVENWRALRGLSVSTRRVNAGGPKGIIPNSDACGTRWQEDRG